MPRSSPSASADGLLRAEVIFEDPVLEGHSLKEVARHYRPLMNVQGGDRMSCFFEKIGTGTGSLGLGVPYTVLIRLPMMSALEQHYRKTVRQLFPQGRALKMVSLPERVVATGVVQGVVELH